MNALTKPEATALPAVQQYSDGLLDVISRAARDPNVDIDKMERLLQMQERVQARDSKSAFDQALSEMMPELPEIVEHGGIPDRSGKIQSTYAKWEDINAAIKPILAKYGFGLTFRNTEADDGRVRVTGILSRAGHREETTVTLPHDGSGSKNAVQAVGSSTSYGQRYAAKLLLNLTSRGMDDDGAAGGNAKLVDDVQLARLLEVAEQVGADIKRFCDYMGVRSMGEIPAAKFDAAIDKLRAKKAIVA